MLLKRLLCVLATVCVVLFVGTSAFGNSIAEAKKMSEGSMVFLQGKVISYVEPGVCFYIEEPDAVMGIRVEPCPPMFMVGDHVDIMGNVQTSPTKERVIMAYNISPSFMGPVLRAWYMRTESMGGTDFGNQQGTWAWRWVRDEQGYPVER